MKMNDPDARRYVVTTKVTDWYIEEHSQEKVWDFVRRDLNEKMARDFFMPLLGNEIINVFSSEYKTWRDYENMYLVFSLTITYSVANEQKFTVMEYSPGSVIVPKEAVPICKWCGQERHSDSRGGCAACGGTK